MILFERAEFLTRLARTKATMAARGIDVLLADTAGRLQNQQGLMDELAKIKRVLARHDESAPHETMLVLDRQSAVEGVVQRLLG